MIRPREEGSALVLALAMLTVIGLMIGVILGFTHSSINAAVVIREQGARIFSADAGIEGAIESIRGDFRWGRDPAEPDASCPTFTRTGINGKNATVECVGLPGSGSTSGVTAPRSAVLALGRNPGEQSIRMFGNEDLRIRGAVRTNAEIVALNNNTRIRVKGPVWSPLPCPAIVTERPEPDEPLPLAMCNPDVDIFSTPTYTPDGLLPPLPAAPPLPLCAPTVTLGPGTYTSSTWLNDYTREGGGSPTRCNTATLLHLRPDPDPTKPSVFYFDFRDDPIWRISRSDIRVIGGTLNLNPLTGQPLPFPNGCQADTGVAGVQVVLVGESRILAAGGTTELCPTGHTGRQRISIFQLPAAGSVGGIARPSGCIVAQPYTGPSGGGSNPCALLTVSGNSTQFYSHGTVYGASAAVDITQNLSGFPVLGRGIVSRILWVHANPNCQGPQCGGDLIAAPDGGWADRTVVFLATVDENVRIRAVVRFEDAAGDIPGDNIRILSWSVRR